MQQPAFRLVIERYRVLRDDAVVVRQRAQVELENARRMLQTLTTYREEQRARASDPTRVISAHALALQSRFADTLDEAVRLQEQRVTEIVARVEHCRETVIRQQQRLKAIEILEQRRNDAVARQLEQRENRAADERASLAASARLRTPA
jgi:flagellar export protein FliJ